ncbi:uncharacterized protein METZ01_LOCUS400303, partial [marine metagenome]
MRILIVFQLFKKLLHWLVPGTVGLSDGEKIYDSGVRMQRQGRLDEAVNRYTEALRVDPSLVQAYSNRGSAYLNLGQPEKAIPDLDQAIQMDPQLAVAYSSRGLAHTNLSNFSQAVKDLNEAVRLNPNFADAYSARG